MFTLPCLLNAYNFFNVLKFSRVSPVSRPPRQRFVCSTPTRDRVSEAPTASAAYIHVCARCVRLAEQSVHTLKVTLVCDYVHGASSENNVGFAILGPLRQSYFSQIRARAR